VSEPGERLRVLGVGAHPDDLEFRVGGALATYAAGGAEVVAMIVTDGGRGSWDAVAPTALASRRLSESRAAARALGVERVLCLHHRDGSVQDAPALRQELCAWLRALRPHVILTHDPWRRYNLHPDHRAVGWACCDALVAARNANYYPEQLERTAPWRPRELLLFLPREVNHVVDISSQIEAKVAAVLCHASQLAGWAARAEPPGGEPADAVRGRVLQQAAAAAADRDFAYGEAVHRLALRGG
jgi:LmbE family N-acetylglucosaminyl deacetylase